MQFVTRGADWECLLLHVLALRVLHWSDRLFFLQQIVEVNNVLRQGLERGLPVQNLMENWWVIEWDSSGAEKISSFGGGGDLLVQGQLYDA